MSLKDSHPSHYVQEWEDDFLPLFPHRFDFIWASHPNPGDSPDWKSEDRYPLSDRQIREGKHLYGVRFAPTTKYILADIDRHSAYHPERDPLAIPRILERLETIGLVESVVVLSSHSGGLHLYFPFSDPQQSWLIAHAVAAVLGQIGVKVAPGQLELFPNVRPFTGLTPTSLYAAHRLPLQAGSYMIERAPQSKRGWELVGWDQSVFVQRWHFAQGRNDVDTNQLESIVKAARYEERQISKKAAKFLDDLRTEIRAGWSGRGQTNRLLGKIATHTYVFGHVEEFCEPFEDDRLVRKIIEVAVRLPGYQEHCAHQHEIFHRAAEWGRCVEASHYYHYGEHQSSKLARLGGLERKPNNVNEQRSQEARDRIRWAIADLLNQDALPIGATARFELLSKQYRISGTTLYKYRDLWHPNYFVLDDQGQPEQPDEVIADLVGELVGEHDDLWKTPQTPLVLDHLCPTGCAEGAPAGGSIESLLDAEGCNPLSELSSSGPEPEQSQGVCNFDSSPDPGNSTLDPNAPSLPQFSGREEDGPKYIAQILSQIRRPTPWQRDIEHYLAEPPSPQPGDLPASTDPESTNGGEVV